MGALSAEKRDIDSNGNVLRWIGFMKLFMSLRDPQIKKVFDLLDIQYTRDILPLLDTQHRLCPRDIRIFVWQLDSCSLKDIRKKIAAKLRNSPKEARSPLLIRQKMQEFKDCRESLYSLLQLAHRSNAPVFVDI